MDKIIEIDFTKAPPHANKGHSSSSKSNYYLQLTKIPKHQSLDGKSLNFSTKLSNPLN